jgi:hypothetical protein
VPKNHDLWAAVNLWFHGVCKVKNRLIGDFFMFLREAQQTPSAERMCIHGKWVFNWGILLL